MKSKKLLRGATLIGLLMIISMLAGACAPAAPETVEVIVTKEVEVVKTVEVEKEVEKLVEVVVTPTAVPMPEGGVKTIPLMTTENDPATVALFQEIIAEFEAENPDVRIDLVLTAHGSELERLVTANAVGAELGIVGIHPESLIQYVDAGYLLPLDSVVDELGRDKFKTGAVLNYTDHDFAMGYAAGNNGTLWVRTDLLEAAGLAVPTTYDELLAAAEALTKDNNGDGKIDVYGYGSPAAANGATGLRFVNFVYANCGDYFDKQGNLAFDNPNVLKALERYVELLKFAPPDVVGWSWYDGIIAMTSETIAMHPYGGRLGFNIWRDKPELRKNIKAIWGPYGDVQAGDGGYDYFAISANVRWPEEAKAFMKYLYSGDRLARLNMSVPGHLVPPTIEIQEAMMAMENEYANAYPEDMAVLFDSANFTANPALFMGAVESDSCTFNPVYNPMPWGSAIFGESPIDTQMVEKVVAGGMSPEEAWKWAYTEMQRIADEWKAENPDWVSPLAE